MNLIYALILAIIVYLVAGLVFPAPWPLILGLLTFVLMAFGDRLTTRL